MSTTGELEKDEQLTNKAIDKLTVVLLYTNIYLLEAARCSNLPYQQFRWSPKLYELLYR